MRAMHKGLALLTALGALVLCMAAEAARAQPGQRIALVIGNSTYRHVPSLQNATNDATLIADALRKVGFSLVGDGPQLDLDEHGFRRAVRSFGEALTGGDVALFFYAGHGVQLRGSNYLVPVGANPIKEADVDFQMLDTNLVLRQMESAGTRLNILILDACRNNPFGGRGLRTTAPGLAQMQAPQGTLISFATQPGNVALDGSDGNSPYTKALAQAIQKPGLDIFRTFNDVGLRVSKDTNGVQQPWVSLSPISGNFYFAGLPAAPDEQRSDRRPDIAPTDPAERAWAAIQNTTSPAVLQAFIAEYGQSFYGRIARARLEELTRSQVALQIPPVTASRDLTALLRTQTPTGLRVTASSTTWGGNNTRVVDGRTDGDYHVWNHTGKGPDEWLQVDLGAEYRVSRVDVYNRNAYGPRLNGAAVELRDRAGKLVARFDPITGAHDGSRHEFVTDRRARFIRITHRNQYLHVTEIKVYGEAETPAPVDVTPVVGIPGDAVTPRLGAAPLSPERERALRPRDTFQECDLCPAMVVVPAGSFMMGSAASEPDRKGDEGPQRRVSIRQAFAVGRMEISVDQFTAFVNETGYDAGSMCYTYEGGKWDHRQVRSFRNPGFVQTGQHPAGCLNWHDAQAYVAWLSSRTGKHYRLLSEAEWEYVARAGTTGPFWWGTSIDTSQANFDGTYSYAGGTTGQFRAKSTPVNSFEPNPWGLFQVHGNLWEWVEDCRHDQYLGGPTDGSAWITGDCRRRSLRGGSWAFHPTYLRSAARSGFSGPADLRGANVGLRVARTLLAR